MHIGDCNRFESNLNWNKKNKICILVSQCKLCHFVLVLRCFTKCSNLHYDMVYMFYHLLHCFFCRIPLLLLLKDKDFGKMHLCSCLGNKTELACHCFLQIFFFLTSHLAYSLGLSDIFLGKD